MPKSVGNTGIKALEFVEIATADLKVLDRVLQQLHFRKIAVHRSKAVSLYRQGSLNIVVNCEAQAIQSLQDQSAGSQIRAMAVRVENAKESYETLIKKGAWGREFSGEAMELNIPSIEIVGGCALYLVESAHSHFSIYDIDFKPLENVQYEGDIFNHINCLSLNVTQSHSSQWRDFFVQLLGFSEQGGQLQSPDKSFFIKFNAQDSVDIANEGFAGISLQAILNEAEPSPLTDELNKAVEHMQSLPESIGFEVEIKGEAAK